VTQVVRSALILLTACTLHRPVDGQAQGPTPAPFGPRPAAEGGADFPRAALPPASGFPSYPATSSYGLPPSTPVQPWEGELFEPAQIAAQVGDQYILRGELLGDANLILYLHYVQLEKMPVEQREAGQQELVEFREQLIEKRLLQQAIDRKLKYIEFLRTLPAESDVKKADERWKRIQAQAAKMFAEKLDEMVSEMRNTEPEGYAEIAKKSEQLYRIALVMKEAGIPSREDPGLDRLLRAYGTSLVKQQQEFMESALGQAAVGNQVDFRPEITHEQLVNYYREHESEFFIPQRARWEQLSVLFLRVPDEQQAMALICSMGNQVVGGAPLWAVAQRSSQEKMASRGGYHDWTSYGDLTVSRVILDAVFSLPLNELSQIIRDDEGLHIVRVTERQDAHQTPFIEVQGQIKEKLQNEALTQAYSEFVMKLREKTPIVTDFHAAPTSRVAQPPSAQPLR
jgi:hypothetical protein